MNTLEHELLSIILEFCGEYAYVTRQVCRRFRNFSLDVPLLAYLNRLCLDNKEEKLSKRLVSSLSVEEMLRKGYLQLISLLLEYECVSVINLSDMAAVSFSLPSCIYLHERGIIRPSSMFKAAEAGCIELVSWFLQTFPEERDVNIQRLRMVAGREGNIDLLEMLNLEKAGDRYLRWLAYRVIEGKRLNVLSWLREKNLLRIPDPLPMSAIKDLTMIKFLFESNSIFFPGVTTLCNVASHNALALEYLLQKYGDGGSIWNLVHSVSMEGELQTLKLLKRYARKKGITILWDEDIISVANSLEKLKWLRKQGCPWSEKTTKKVLRRGNVEMLEWLKEKGCPFGEHVCVHACRNSLDVIKWVLQQGYVWEEERSHDILDYGNVEAAEFIIEQGLKVNVKFGILCIHEGHERLFVRAYLSGLLPKSVEYSHAMIEYDNVELLERIHNLPLEKQA